MAIEVIEIGESGRDTYSQPSVTSTHYKNITATMAPLSTKRKRQTSRYSRANKNQRKPETYPISLIIIEESPRGEERIEEIFLKE